jgi:hypothetical protein
VPQLKQPIASLLKQHIVLTLIRAIGIIDVAKVPQASRWKQKTVKTLQCSVKHNNKKVKVVPVYAMKAHEAVEVQL